ncbi:MAG: glucan biosynthesis protein, partial [Pseudomonadota bacterium]
GKAPWWRDCPTARGLAIDTAQSGGEEFPYFRSFWIEAPSPGASAVVVHALLDSPSTTGLYRITMRPGQATLTDVELTLFPRRDIATIGFAPFSSMFLFNGINRGDFHDYRAAVHDSEGLSVHTGSGQWLWRPITNPERLEVSAFVDTTPRGFGLIQRKRLFLDYQDAEARYETRPSAWVEPIGDWRRGAVVLFEIPTRFEGNDNVVAYWQPEAGVRQGEPFSLTYRIHWDGEAASGTEGPRVAATRRGRNLTDTKEKFVIDFDMRGRKRAGEVTVEASRGKIESITQYPTPEDNILRVSFELDTDANESIELRLNLIPAEGPMGEHWLYRWTA